MDKKTAKFRVGVDTGGTFTDLIVIGDDGRLLRRKTLSTPDDFSRGILQALTDVFKEYGLTGAIFSNDRSELERARHDLHVGNLYINRKCTGAIFGAHPFGGFNMSGTDSKAGGPDYLNLFTQAKSVGEKIS